MHLVETVAEISDARKCTYADAGNTQHRTKCCQYECNAEQLPYGDCEWSGCGHVCGWTNTASGESRPSDPVALRPLDPMTMRPGIPGQEPTLNHVIQPA